MPDSTPTGTPTETDTPTPEPEELDLQYSNVNNSSDIADDIIEAQVSPSENTDRMVFGVGPSEGFENVHRALENGDAYITQKINEVPENGQVQFTFPWMNFLYSQAEQMKEETDQSYVWPEVGGEQTLFAKAKSNGENYEDTLETVPVTLLHPREDLDLQAHNQRTTNMWSHQPAYGDGEEFIRQQVYDVELLRQIAGPIIDQNLAERFSGDSRPRMDTEEQPSLDSTKFVGNATFDYFFDGEDGPWNSSYTFFLKDNNLAEEVIEDQFDFERTQETGGEEFEVFRYESGDYVAEMTYDSDRQTLIWSSNGGVEDWLDRPVAFDKALEVLTGNIETIHQQDNFTDTQAYSSNFFPLVGYSHTPDELSKQTDGRGNTVMLRWDSESGNAYEEVRDAEMFELVNDPFNRNDSSYLWNEF